jgi:hypothetical protein
MLEEAWSDDMYLQVGRTFTEAQDLADETSTTSLRPFEANKLTGWTCRRSGHWKDRGVLRIREKIINTRMNLIPA